MSAQESPRPLPLSRGFSKLETLPDGFASKMRRQVSIGDVIGDRYQLLDRIGDGAMGQVFLAENMAIGLRVAVKLLRPELLANPDFRLRFKHEAEAVAAIQHPNVARFLDLVVDDPTFLVMEYVDGPTLDQVIAKERQLAPKRAAEIAIRLGWGLHAAHRAGIIHRDFKPSNIILQRDEESGEVPKIIDFGLAKLAGPSAGASLTRIGQLIGTPHYMAPEQVGGKREVDARSDVYSLGCVLYALLAGRPPFGDTASDDLAVLYRQVHEPVEPITRHAAHVSPELEAVVMRALEKDPDRRFASARDFALALAPTVEKRRSLSAGAAGAAVPPSGQSQIIRRSPASWTLRLTVAALLGTITVLGVMARAKLAGNGSGALLLVVTDPPGASLVLDGKPAAEPTPAAIHDLPAGDHDVRIHRDHYSDVSRIIHLDDKQRETIAVHLTPTSHTVEVHTVPTGATAYIDGGLVAGKTPVSISVSDDEYHAIRVEKSGYETFTRKLKPEESGALPPIALSPELKPRGILFTDSSGPAEVWVDGQYSGFMTPTPGVRVAAGDHLVELRSASGAASEVVHARIGQGETVRLVLPMPSSRRSAR